MPGMFDIPYKLAYGLKTQTAVPNPSAQHPIRESKHGEGLIDKGYVTVTVSRTMVQG